VVHIITSVLERINKDISLLVTFSTYHLSEATEIIPEKFGAKRE
jgi:hypothetical protein